MPETFTTLAEAGKDSANKFLKLLEASKAKNGHFSTIVSVYLTRGGVVKEKTFHRAADGFPVAMATKEMRAQRLPEAH
jgi:hypothetical protein